MGWGWLGEQKGAGAEKKSARRDPGSLGEVPGYMTSMANFGVGAWRWRPQNCPNQALCCTLGGCISLHYGAPCTAVLSPLPVSGLSERRRKPRALHLACEFELM